MTKTMLGSESIIINVDDARKLVDAFLSMHVLDYKAFDETDLKRMHEGGVFIILDGLRDNVRDYDSMYEHLLECGDKKGA